MKRSLTHIKICKRRIKGGCTECTELAKLAYHHAKNCRDVGKCLAPFCPNIKRKIKKRQLTEGYVYDTLYPKWMAFNQNIFSSKYRRMQRAELMLQRLTLDQQRKTKSKSISAAADLLKMVTLDGPWPCVVHLHRIAIHRQITSAFSNLIYVINVNTLYLLAREQLPVNDVFTIFFLIIFECKNQSKTEY